jgi:hypothetical protein
MDDLWMDYAVQMVNELDLEENVVADNVPRVHIVPANGFNLSDNVFKQFYRLYKFQASKLYKFHWQGN